MKITVCVKSILEVITSETKPSETQ